VSELFRNVPFLTHEKISPFVWSIVVAGQECGRQWGRAAAGPSSARRARGLRRSDRGPIGGRAPGRSHHSKGDISKEFTWGHFHGVATQEVVPRRERAIDTGKASRG
jgi:hypothetical protein